MLVVTLDKFIHLAQHYDISTITVSTSLIKVILHIFFGRGG
jgi:hypothetical protein